MRPCTTCKHSNEPGYVPVNQTTQDVFEACAELGANGERFTTTDVRDYLGWPVRQHSKINNALAQLAPRHVQRRLSGRLGFEWCLVDGLEEVLAARRYIQHLRDTQDDRDRPLADYDFFEWDGNRDRGPGWYYVIAESPDEGSCGPFNTESLARDHALDHHR